MKLSEGLTKEIISYCENNPIILDFDYRDELSKEQISKILESDEGLQNLEDEIYNNSLDYIFESELYFLENTLYDFFESELTEEFSEEYPDESERWIESEIKEYLNDNFRDYISISYDIKQLLNNTGNIPCLIKVYSNYDCCNSFDKIEDEGYLKDVFRRVRHGVRKSDYVYEFYNGAYGGSLFCFAFETSLENLIALKQGMKTAKYLSIPKGTQFGFFSSFQGAGSVFEKTTYKNMKILIEESEYDSVDIIADCQQHYSIDQVYGQNDFFNEQNILTK